MAERSLSSCKPAPSRKGDCGEAGSAANMLPTVSLQPVLTRGNEHRAPHLNGISFGTKARKYKRWFALLITHMTVPFVFQRDERQG